MKEKERKEHEKLLKALEYFIVEEKPIPKNMEDLISNASTAGLFNVRYISREKEKTRLAYTSNAGLSKVRFVSPGEKKIHLAYTSNFGMRHYRHYHPVKFLWFSFLRKFSYFLSNHI